MFLDDADYDDYDYKDYNLDPETDFEGDTVTGKKDFRVKFSEEILFSSIIRSKVSQNGINFIV